MEENNNTEILADVVSSKKKTPVIIINGMNHIKIKKVINIVGISIIPISSKILNNILIFLFILSTKNYNFTSSAKGYTELQSHSYLCLSHSIP